MTKEELEIAKAACCVGTIWDEYEGKENFDHMVGLRVKHLIELVRYYQQSSLPSNLDEAAEEVMPISYGSLEVDCYGGSEPVYSREQMVEIFKSGAEWMAGQGVSADSGVCKLADRAWITPIDEKKFMQDVFDNFVAGDKVVVQIRKK